MVPMRFATILSTFIIVAILSAYALEDQHHQSLVRNKRGSWNGAKGMWGKRDAGALVDPEDEEGLDEMEKRGWSKASGMWGKRASLDDEFGMDAEKRGTWNKASGMWGKRAGWNGAKGMWGRRKRSAPLVISASERR